MTSALDVDGVSFSYGPVPALSHVSLAVREGESVAVLGPNGAGKSTLISVLLGLLRPKEGSARLFGIPCREAVTKGLVGAMLQGQALPSPATVTSLMTYLGRLYPRTMEPERALALAGAADLRDRRVDRLSGGQRRRLQFAMALLVSPPLLFLDEPTEGLDIEARAGLWERLGDVRKEGVGTTTLFTTHDLSEADSFADRVLLLAEGRVVALDTPERLKADLATARVRFRSDGAFDPEGAARALGVPVRRLAGTLFEAEGADTDGIIRRLVALDAPLFDFAIVKGTLDEVFRSITTPKGVH